MKTIFVPGCIPSSEYYETMMKRFRGVMDMTVADIGTMCGVEERADQLFSFIHKSHPDWSSDSPVLLIGYGYGSPTCRVMISKMKQKAYPHSDINESCIRGLVNINGSNNGISLTDYLYTSKGAMKPIFQFLFHYFIVPLLYVCLFVCKKMKWKWISRLEKGSELSNASWRDLWEGNTSFHKNNALFSLSSIQGKPVYAKNRDFTHETFSVVNYIQYMVFPVFDWKRVDIKSLSIKEMLACGMYCASFVVRSCLFFLVTTLYFVLNLYYTFDMNHIYNDGIHTISDQSHPNVPHLDGEQTTSTQLVQREFENGKEYNIIHEHHSWDYPFTESNEGMLTYIFQQFSIDRLSTDDGTDDACDTDDDDGSEQDEADRSESSN